MGNLPRSRINTDTRACARTRVAYRANVQQAYTSVPFYVLISGNITLQTTVVQDIFLIYLNASSVCLLEKLEKSYET